MKRIFQLTFFCIVITCLCTGCWNYREVEDLAIVAGAAIDKAEDGFLITMEVVDIQEDQEAKVKSAIVTSTGFTMYDAIRNTIKITGKRLYWSHAKSIIISEEIAKEGLVPVLDWLARDGELRETLKIIISKEKTAQEILQQPHIIHEILSFEMDNVFKAQKSLSNSPDIMGWQLLKELAGSGIDPVLPTVFLSLHNGMQVPDISGTAIFKKDHLQGYLNGDETKIMLFIKDQFKGGLLSAVIVRDHMPIKVTLELPESKTKLKPIYKNGQFSMQIKTNSYAGVGEIEGTMNLIENDGGYKELQKEFESILEKEITDLIKKVQKEYGCDIFGFGNMVKIHYPSVWREVEGEWNDIFKTLEVEVESKIKIENTAIQSKPIKVRD